jgi:hypothetical protein
MTPNAAGLLTVSGRQRPDSVPTAHRLRRTPISRFGALTIAKPALWPASAFLSGPSVALIRKNPINDCTH